VTAVVPVVDKELCNRCGLCVDSCPCHAIEMGEEGPIFHCSDECAKLPACALDCGAVCEEACPTGAITCSFEIVIEDDDVVQGSKD
jgi:ferredoxin